MKEEWKDVKGFEGHYKVSNTGKVHGVKRGKLLKPVESQNNQGFKCLIVSLSSNGKRVAYLLHRLVYRHFKEDPNGMIEFLDGNYKNCSIENLLEVLKTAKFKKSHCRRVINSETMKLYDSLSDLARELGVKSQSVQVGIDRKFKKYNKYRFI